ncbi:MAG: shikimate dehydrogenase [Candidatus Calescibacterium sp.]|nr:shikimate dehydrogenase [Candidatus Calescibacterium sp.]MDW8132043.1 shikimate dehydrogenase [Candidatus Calescibacterium sp.]
MKGPFAFFIHPLSIVDLYRAIPSFQNKSVEFVESVIKFIDPFVAVEMEIETSANERVYGLFIVIPLLSKQFVEDEKLAMSKLIKGSRLAIKFGAKIVGLGAFTSIVGKAGMNLVKNFGDVLYFTSGASYTVASSLEVLDIILDKRKMNKKDLNIAVVGATGAIGKAITKLVVRDYKKVFAVARNKTRLNVLKNEIKADNIFVSTDILASCLNSDVVITATSNPSEIIFSRYLRHGAIVCDISMPHNTSEEVIKNRKDVTVIEGGVIELPSEPKFKKLFNDLSWNDIIGFPENNVLACMAETIILTAEEKYENYSIGRNIDENKIMEISLLAKKHGFKVRLRKKESEITPNIGTLLK